ncbi:hypothetical protein ACYJ1Y_14320 [Natrialbaceae archaeon A-gly3]
MRLLAAATAAGIGGTAATGVVSADDDGDSLLDDPVLNDYRHTAAFATMPGWYVVMRGVDSWRSSTTAHGEALWDQIYADGLEMYYRRHTALNSITNNAEMMSQYLRLDVAEAIVEAGEQEEAEKEDAEQAGLEVLEDTVSIFHKQLYNYWMVDFMASLRRIHWAVDDDTGDIDMSAALRSESLGEDGAILNDALDSDDSIHQSAQTLSDLYTELVDEGVDDDEVGDDDLLTTMDDGDWSTDTLPYQGLQVPNGDDYTILCVNAEQNDSGALLSPWGDVPPDYFEPHPYENQDWQEQMYTVLGEEDLSPLPGVDDDLGGYKYRILIGERDPDDEAHGAVPLLDAKPFAEADQAIRDQYEAEAEHIMIMVDALWDDIQDGEVTSDEVASGSAIKEAGEEGDDWQAMAAYYRSVGMPEAKEYVTVEYAGVEFVGSLFLTDSEEDAPLPVGETIDPADLEGEVHGALEVVDVFDVDDDQAAPEEGTAHSMQLVDEFEIVSTADGSDELEFESRELISDDYTTDEIVAALTDAYAAEKESREGSTEVDASIGIGMSNPLDGVAGSWLGLGIIAGVVMLVIGFVTDALPGLGD